MKKELLEISNRIILYNDDNHDPDIYINGKAAGSLEDKIDALESAFIAGRDSKLKGLFSIEVCLCDLPDDLTSDEIDAIHDFFCKTATLTIDQEVAIFNEDYKTLLKLM